MRRGRLWTGAAVLLLAAACTSSSQPPSAPTASGTGIHKIQHVIVIMQENRSFDSYFGTYPKADGIPMKGGKPSVCVPDPLTSKCVAPFVDHKDQNPGAPHKDTDSVADVDGGKTKGFWTRVDSRLPLALGWHLAGS